MRRGKRNRAVQQANTRPAPAAGGRFAPLSSSACDQIIEAAFAILERIGVSGAPSEIRDLALANGAAERGDGRIVLSRALVEDKLATACKRVELPGFDRDPRHRSRRRTCAYRYRWGRGAGTGV